LNTDGSVDKLFGQAGSAGFSFTVDGGPAVQTDGRIVVVGGTEVGNAGIFAVGRLNTNGTLDATFGTGGSVSTDFGPRTNGNAFGVAIQPDGRIIVVGDAGTNGTMNSSFGLIRLQPERQRGWHLWVQRTSDHRFRRYSGHGQFRRPSA
jgi:uncharacterized delta-60 repeat protein